MPVRDPFQISALKFSRDLELAGQLCTPRKWRPSMEAFAITAARNFARVLLIRAENTMTHLGMLGARRPVSLVDAESLRMWVVPDSPDAPPHAGARKRPRPRNGALQPIQRKPRTA